MNLKALQNISYGLYLLTVSSGGKDNGCIVNTVVQVTSSPLRISVAVNKQNLTQFMIAYTKQFNISLLSESADFALFQRFGFQSGREVDKFDGFDGAERAANGIYYLTEGTNAYVSCKVVDSVDLGTHMLFIADVETAEVLNCEPSMTYAYYHANVKPQPTEADKRVNGYRCKICGYIYEGEELPADFVCPLCKHGAEDFEKI